MHPIMTDFSFVRYFNQVEDADLSFCYNFVSFAILVRSLRNLA